MNTIDDKLAAALRDCRMLARTSCYPHDLMAGIITHASKAIAECPATVRKRHKFAAALRACIDLAHNCPRDELADAIIKTVSNALAEYNPQQATDLIRSLLAVVVDLHNGYPIRELHVDLDTLRRRAAELGVVLEGEG